MSSNVQTSGMGNGRQNFRIRPSNAPSDGIFAHQGQPVLTFELPNSNVLLDPSKLRLVGKYRIKAGTLNEIQEGDKVRIDQYLGINSCFENVAWSSKMSRSVIEKVNNYPKLINSIRPALSSTQNYQSNLQVESIATQNLDFANNAYGKLAFGNGGVAVGVDFCTSIFTGLTMASGNRLPLMKLGGLMLSIDLAPNEAVFTCDNTSLTPQYELYELSLTGEYLVPSAEERGALAGMESGELEMNTFTSLFSILQSSQHNSVFNLGLRELVSVYFSFVPANYINNYLHNQFQCMRISSDVTSAGGATSEQVTKVNFLRNGSQMPFLFDLDVLDKSNEAQLQRYYLMSLKKLSEISRTSIDANINDIRTAIGSTGFKQSSANQMDVLNKENYVLGVPYDMLGNYSGADFSNQPLTINVDSALSDSSPNAMYLYALAKTIVSYSPSGIAVRS
jgi:hypothetical protein